MNSQNGTNMDTSFIGSCVTSTRSSSGCPQTFSPSQMPSLGFCCEYDSIVLKDSSLIAAFGYGGRWYSDFSVSLALNKSHDTSTTITYISNSRNGPGFFFSDQEEYALKGKFPVQIDTSNLGLSCQIHFSGEQVRGMVASLYANHDYTFANPDNFHIGQITESGFDSLTVMPNASLDVNIVSSTAFVAPILQTNDTLIVSLVSDHQLVGISPDARHLSIDCFDALGRLLSSYRSMENQFNLLLPQRLSGLVILRFYIEPEVGASYVTCRKLVIE